MSEVETKPYCLSCEEPVAEWEELICEPCMDTANQEREWAEQEREDSRTAYITSQYNEEPVL